MSIRSMAIHRVDIQQPNAASDGAGGWPTSPSTRLTGVACRIRPLSATEQARYNALNTTVTHRIYFPDTDLDITVGEWIKYKSRLFQIRGVLDIDEWGKLLTVEAEEIEEDE